MSADPEKTAQRRTQVATLTAQGKSVAHIAAVLRTTERTVSRDRHHLGIAKPPSTVMTPEEIQQAQNMLDDGATCAEVAKTLGRSDQTIGRRFPQYILSHHEAGKHASIIRRFIQLERKLA